ncbi:MAG: hypothetical protein M3O02_12020 [Acidobacteriota bacterium]|nr:hypothetical protein [Acidobacteriota bacterium]
MEVSRIIAEIDSQIQKLQQARELLSGSIAATGARKGPGRPKGSKNTAAASSPSPARKGKRNLTPEGRKRIADAMKRRWAERRKQTAVAAK